MKAIEEEGTQEDIEVVLSPEATLKKMIAEQTTPDALQDIQEEKIFEDCLQRVKENSLFSSVVVREDYFSYEDVKARQLGKYEGKSDDEELQQALEMERKGYSKPGMTPAEVAEERALFA